MEMIAFGIYNPLPKEVLIKSQVIGSFLHTIHIGVNWCILLCPNNTSYTILDHYKPDLIYN